MIPSAHLDTFARDNLPPQEQWPQFVFSLPELKYPDRMNCAVELLDRWIESGHGDKPCLISPMESLSYAQLAERVNRIANVLTREVGIVPGNRVLLRGPNSPMMVAAYFAVMKAGAVVVATMPLLRAKEIAYPLNKAKIALTLCDVRLADEMEKARPLASDLRRVVYWGTGSEELNALMAKPGYDTFTACNTAHDDVCLIAFTSGTTGEPKGTMHFHRDILATCDSYGRHVLRAHASDRFIGSPPLAFTFGLGGLALFPLHFGASTVLLEKATPDELLDGISELWSEHCFHGADCLSRDVGKTHAAQYFKFAQMRLSGRSLAEGDVRCLACGNRHLDLRWDWCDRDAAHLHRLAGRRDSPGSTGKVVPGYQARIVDDDGERSCRWNRRPSRGAWADRLPLSRRRHAPTRVRAERMEPHRRFVFTRRRRLLLVSGAHGRHDFSSGTTSPGPRSRTALLAHPAVAECGVVAAPEEERGHIVKAYIVLRRGYVGDKALTKLLQEHVKATIAPYKYPRAMNSSRRCRARNR